MNQVYKIKKSFRIPFVVMTVLLLVLLIITCFCGEVWERILLAALCLAAAVIAVESSERAFAVSESELTIRKFFRTKRFTWAEITYLGLVVMRNKAYFILTTTKGFYMFSNLLQDHTLLIRRLADKLEDEKVEVEVKNYLEQPIERTSLVVLTWIALVIIVAIIITKLI